MGSIGRANNSGVRCGQRTSLVRIPTRTTDFYQRISSYSLFLVADFTNVSITVKTCKTRLAPIYNRINAYVRKVVQNTIKIYGFLFRVKNKQNRYFFIFKSISYY